MVREVNRLTHNHGRRRDAAGMIFARPDRFSVSSIAAGDGMLAGQAEKVFAAFFSDAEPVSLNRVRRGSDLCCVGRIGMKEIGGDQLVCYRAQQHPFNFDGFVRDVACLRELVDDGFE